MNLKHLIILIMSALLSGCLQTENSSSLDDFQAEGSPLFLAANDVFLNKCSNCHDYHVLSEAQLVALDLVVAGDPLNSPIYYRLSGSLGPFGAKNMPTAGSTTAAEVQAVYDWILAVP